LDLNVHDLYDSLFIIIITLRRMGGYEHIIRSQKLNLNGRPKAVKAPSWIGRSSNQTATVLNKCICAENNLARAIYKAKANLSL